MKHFIIAKFKENIDWKSLVPEITAHFDAARQIDGISDVIIHTSCSDRANRFHLMIELQSPPCIMTGKRSTGKCSKAKPSLTVNNIRYRKKLTGPYRIR